MNNELNNLIDEVFADQNKFIKMTVSNPINKSVVIKKVVVITFDDYYQIQNYINDQVKHVNIEHNITGEITEFITNYKQIDINLTDSNIKVLVNKKGSCKIIKKQATNIKKEASHNKEKNYLINEGEYIHFLHKLQIMDDKGFVYPSKQKKFKQINKFLENIKLIEDDLDEVVNIVDIGCGKAYLTFSVYYYLTSIGKTVNILGIDLKEEVIKYCADLALECKFDGLEFVCADIFKYDIKFDYVNLVMTLHACNNATDYALYNAVKFSAKNILSVPCCQHELKKTIKNDELDVILKHGVFKDRFASMLTDSIRGELLKAYGYNVVIGEFIDLEYTAKNVLIKANKKTNKIDQDLIDEVQQLLNDYNVSHALYDLLQNNKKED